MFSYISCCCRTITYLICKCNRSCCISSSCSGCNILYLGSVCSVCWYLFHCKILKGIGVATCISGCAIQLLCSWEVVGTCIVCRLFILIWKIISRIICKRLSLVTVWNRYVRRLFKYKVKRICPNIKPFCSRYFDQLINLIIIQSINCQLTSNLIGYFQHIRIPYQVTSRHGSRRRIIGCFIQTECRIFQCMCRSSRICPVFV